MEIKNLSFTFGDKIILQDVNLFFSKNEKIGLVGPNGAGKTTFFKLILGDLLPHSGEIIMKKGTNIGYLPQIIAEKEESDCTVEDYICAARPIKQLEEKLDFVYSSIDKELDENKQNRLLREAQVLQETLEDYDWYEYKSIMLNITNNMKITAQMLKKKVKELSGGQKSQVAFARLLYSKVDLMLLDEPTNHLDTETKKFVMDFLKKYSGTVLVISHDKDFLNEVTSTTFFFDPRTHKIIRYPGNYSVFEKLHSEYEKNLEDRAKKQEQEISKLEDIIGRLDGTSGKRKKMAQDREKKLEKILSERIITPSKEKDVEFRIVQNRDENSIPIELKNVSFRYPNTQKDIISNLSFDIKRKERFLIVGRNGAGKSTLLKLISRVLTPDRGVIAIGTKVDMGYYAQEHESLNLDQTILQNFSMYKVSNKKLRGMLAHFLFFGDDVNKKVGVLSPGERARVALAKLSLSGSNTILLDEPTNHLDPKTQEIIAKVFNEFSGTIVVVSHNPHFVDSLNIERMLVLPEGKIIPYNKNTVKLFYKANTRNIDN